MEISKVQLVSRDTKPSIMCCFYYLLHYSQIAHIDNASADRHNDSADMLRDSGPTTYGSIPALHHNNFFLILQVRNFFSNLQKSPPQIETREAGWPSPASQVPIQLMDLTTKDKIHVQW